MTFIWLILLISIIKILLTDAYYDTAYVEDLCKSSGLQIWNIGSGNSNSSGILRSTRNEEFLKGRNCTVTIQPPLGYGIILSIRSFDFRPFYPPICSSYVEITDETKLVKLCGYSDDRSEYQAYFSQGKAMKINFVTVNETGSQYFSNIYFVATSYIELSYHCGLKFFQCENSRCIWKGLTCDGHNNCGDQTDELSRGNSSCGRMSPSVIVAIVVGSIMGLIVLLIIPFVWYRFRSAESDPPLIDNTRDQPYTTSVEERPQSIQQPSSSHGRSRYDDLPPAYKP